MTKPNRDDPKYPPGDAGTAAYEADESAWRAEERAKAGGGAVGAKKSFGAATEGTERLIDPKTGRQVGQRRVITGAVAADEPADLSPDEPEMAADPDMPKKPAGASLGDLAAYNEAMRKYKAKKAGPKTSASPYPN